MTANQDRRHRRRKLSFVLGLVCVSGFAALTLTACRGGRLPGDKPRGGDTDIDDLLDGSLLDWYRQSLCAAEVDDDTVLQLHPP